jgi:hypothetical protein
MERRTFIGVLSGSLLAAPLVCHGQTVPTLPRVGLLRPGSPPDPYVDAFRQRLTELGYVERRSIAFEYRWAEGYCRDMLRSERVRMAQLSHR